MLSPRFALALTLCVSLISLPTVSLKAHALDGKEKAVIGTLGVLILGTAAKKGYEVHQEAKARRLVELERQKQVQAQIVAQQQQEAAIAARKQAIDNCDAMTGHPQDPSFVRSRNNTSSSYSLAALGVADDKIDGKAGYSACMQALQYPEIQAEPRYHFQIGRSLWSMGEYAGAIKAFNKAAELGYYPANHYLAQAYASGKGVTQSAELAKTNYLTAAKREFSPSQSILKDMNISYKTLAQESEDSRRLAEKQEAERLRLAKIEADKKLALEKQKQAAEAKKLANNPNRPPTDTEMAKAIQNRYDFLVDANADRLDKIAQDGKKLINNSRNVDPIAAMVANPMNAQRLMAGIFGEVMGAAGLNYGSMTKSLKQAQQVHSVRAVDNCYPFKGYDGYICMFKLSMKDPLSDYVTAPSGVSMGNFYWINGNGWQYQEISDEDKMLIMKY